MTHDLTAEQPFARVTITIENFYTGEIETMTIPKVKNVVTDWVYPERESWDGFRFPADPNDKTPTLKFTVEPTADGKTNEYARVERTNPHTDAKSIQIAYDPKFE